MRNKSRLRKEQINSIKNIFKKVNMANTNSCYNIIIDCIPFELYFLEDILDGLKYDLERKYPQHVFKLVPLEAEQELFIQWEIKRPEFE